MDKKYYETVGMQPASLDTWTMKYQLKTKEGEVVDGTVLDSYKRVAKALSSVESTIELQQIWYNKFLQAMLDGAIPAGRIMSNSGADKYKPKTSTINCTVSGTIHDSMDDILTKVHEAGITLKSGCGIGYEFSTLRPKGAFVSGAGSYTSGPVSFMHIYDKMCLTISSAGARRGAQMGTFDIRHPDVLEFIKAKREDGVLRQFNLSILISDQFIDTVKKDAMWNFSFPISRKEADSFGLSMSDTSQIEYRYIDIDGDYVRDYLGRTACRIHSTIKAKKLWNIIMCSTYDYAEPGFILIDKVNRMNNNWFCEDIRATNPCGEQPLPPYGACLLGSINLTKYVRNPFQDNCYFDYVAYESTIMVFTRMLDNVIEASGLPLEKQNAEILRKRRHGMGFMGLGSAMVMMGIKYGSPESIGFTISVAERLAVVGFRAGVELAKEKGEAPIMSETFIVTKEMIHKRPEIGLDYKEGDVVTGRVLIARYSKYMQVLKSKHPLLVKDIENYGCRFTHHSSIAPTGTLALTFGNNISNGIEPSFSHKYSRNIIKPGQNTKEKIDVLSYELLAYREFFDDDADLDSLPDYFISASDVTPKQHVDVQAAAQYWVDSSISKTINVPTDIPFDEFSDIYMYAYDKGLKGATTFRFNPEVFQGVLVKDSDLETTEYEFTLKDGSTVTAKGTDTIEYDGEEHSAANLFDAIKEGYYGKLG